MQLHDFISGRPFLCCTINERCSAKKPLAYNVIAVSHLIKKFGYFWHFCHMSHGVRFEKAYNNFYLRCNLPM